MTQPKSVTTPYKPGDLFTVEETVYPAWWQFWKAPRTVLQEYQVEWVSPAA